MIDSLYEPFKKWSATGSVYIISDPHFEDGDCKLMDPDWPEPQEYINNIKKQVHKNDTLICLGDVGNPEWFGQLNCYKVLIMGNHDKGQSNYEPWFNEIYGGPLLISPHIMLSHEPCESLHWCNLHGHCHKGEFFEENGGYNFAANVVNFNIFSLGDMIKIGLIKKQITIDIHRMTIETAKIQKEISENFIEEFKNY